jgi:hypothetical protein
MQRQWTVRRIFQPHRDGQRRWDRAYQQLLAGTSPEEQEAHPRVPRPPPSSEEAHESRNLCNVSSTE